MLEIRLIPAADAAVAGRLLEVAYEAIPDGWPLDEAGYRTELTDVASRMTDAVVVGAYWDGRLVGCVTYVAPGASLDEHGGDHPSFRMLGVDPRAQGRGIGAALVRWVVERARLEGHHELRLYTAEPMRVAQRMYERMGFERRADQDWAFAPNRVLLAYVLSLAVG